MKKKLIPLFLVCILISLVSLSCSYENHSYDGVWKIESASDIQSLLEMGLEIKLIVNTTSKEVQIWTYVNGTGTLQNTAKLYAFNDDHYAFDLPDLEPEHYGRHIFGKLTLLDNKLHYSTGINNDWVFVKE